MSDPFEKIYSKARSGRYKNALQILIRRDGDRIREEYSGDLNHAWYVAGDLLFKMSRYQDALEAFRKSVRHWPKDNEALWAMAECYSKLKRPKMAIRYVQKALSAGGPKDELLFNLGNAYFDMKQFRKAIDAYKKVRLRSRSVYRHAKKNMQIAQQRIERG